MQVDAWSECSITLDGVRFPTVPDNAKHCNDVSAPGGGVTCARIPIETNRTVVSLIVDDAGGADASLEVDLGPEAEGLRMERFIDCQIIDGTIRPIVNTGDDEDERLWLALFTCPEMREVATPDDVLALVAEWGTLELGR